MKPNAIPKCKENIMTPKQKQKIDNMSQHELCSKWRFASIHSPLLKGDTGVYFSKVLKEKGGFTPEISKKLGYPYQIKLW